MNDRESGDSRIDRGIDGSRPKLPNGLLGVNMTYRQDLSNSARRHLRAGSELYALASAGAQPGCRAVAGYLFGLCGELAVKAIMRDSGMPPLEPDRRREDPYYKHFPELKTFLLNTAKGRRSGELLTIANTTALFQYWDTDMRYAKTLDIRDEWIESWKTSAADLVNRMDSF